jgi:hypothetical protein
MCFQTFENAFPIQFRVRVRSCCCVGFARTVLQCAPCTEGVQGNETKSLKQQRLKPHCSQKQDRFQLLWNGDSVCLEQAWLLWWLCRSGTSIFWVVALCAACQVAQQLQARGWRVSAEDMETPVSDDGQGAFYQYLSRIFFILIITASASQPGRPKSTLHSYAHCRGFSGG